MDDRVRPNTCMGVGRRKPLAPSPSPAVDMASTPVETPRSLHAAELYREAKSADLSPHLRESKLQDAIRLWNGILSWGEGQQSTLHKNLGLAHQALGDLTARDSSPVLDTTMRSHHLKESLQCFTSAFRAGISEGRSAMWTEGLPDPSQSMPRL